jgi:hypothetical protein
MQLRTFWYQSLQLYDNYDRRKSKTTKPEVPWAPSWIVDFRCKIRLGNNDFRTQRGLIIIKTSDAKLIHGFHLAFNISDFGSSLERWYTSYSFWQHSSVNIGLRFKPIIPLRSELNSLHFTSTREISISRGIM